MKNMIKFILLPALLFTMFAIQTPSLSAAETEAPVSVVKHKHRPGYKWISGHYEKNKFGKLVWIPGHWKKI
ncbi:MAG TPA: YXWGXW repeat-containing protein [Ignavibacteria bacterium]|nr:YXWGXW repeat-containing protein [Ignavibacteria bacterium]